MMMRREAHRKRAGAFVPLFSVYSARSAGVGDFEDLKLAVDWCERTGQTILQLLPMNDNIASVFAPTSLFALDPEHVAIDRLVGVREDWRETAAAELRQAFPTGKGFVDYGVKMAKVTALRGLFERIGGDCPDPRFLGFLQKQRYWLHDYALFMAIKQVLFPGRWDEWGEPFRNRDPEALDAFAQENFNEIQFHKWVQWQLYEQLSEAKRYADSKNVQLMGDYFYIAMSDSADTWSNRELFRLDCCSGLPSEPSSPKGQRWDDQPVYDWSRIKADDYRLVKHRLAYYENFYHMLRIDHPAAFFRTWCIPFEEPWENQGQNGFFYPSDFEEWEEQGTGILRTILSNTKLTLCAENLGPFTTFFTPEVRGLGIPIINFQRWEKDYGNTYRFTDPKQYDYLTAIVLSTHDTSCWADWWDNEAGTVDTGWFRSYCGYLDFKYETVKDKLFDPARSDENKLRWRSDVDTVEKMLRGVDRHAFQVEGLVKEYRSTYGEKEQLLEMMGLDSSSRYKAGREVLPAAMASALRSNAVYCIHSIIDWLVVLGYAEGNYADLRFNRPGDGYARNWSLTLPLSLEELLEDRLVGPVKEVVDDGLGVAAREG
ncbi:4-alpha-glucanotransferase [Cohnella faecalis]|uniref:4-alpha-glucanotransferase n=1 Tax=Cohnella faecalis TaxID=2315694 RepID=A0A398CKY7_9BACL|nr:4-alpha-glucanotransferase [Cohnella faecalis]RIE03986.1 hypothetical protein D3H35_08490 [Cohnella faecalis]